jgi:plastocyanin
MGASLVKRKSLMGPALMFVALCLASSASAGSIAGTIRVRAVPPQSARPSAYAGRADAMPGMHASPRGLVTDAVVYLDHVPAGVESSLTVPGPHPKLAQKDQSFAPRVLPVAVGTAVDFPNLDPIYHNVFSLSPIKRFDLGKYPRGQFKTVVFNRSGLVNVFCDIHSDMEAFVLVLPHHAFTQPGADGSFTLPDVPPGHYTVHVWHPDLPEQTLGVDVPASGTVTVEIAL